MVIQHSLDITLNISNIDFTLMQPSKVSEGIFGKWVFLDKPTAFKDFQF